MSARAGVREVVRGVPAGYSGPGGKRWAAGRLADMRPGSACDVGPGSGTWARMLRLMFPVAHLACVEAWEPYVRRFELERLYDEVAVADARDAPLPEADVVILGDVLDRMDAADAARLWARARGAARVAVLASVAVAGHRTPADDGNPYERRAALWSHEVAAATLDGVCAWTLDGDAGVYLAPGCRRPGPAAGASR
jgi:hypothetical protein